MSSAIDFPPVSVSRPTFSISVPALRLEKGEILGIFGKSGSGKTTYMKCIREHFAPERIHYMSQYDCLLEESTIRQNIELGLVCSTKAADEIREWETTYRELLGEFEVDRHLHKYPRMMSGGQRKRAEIVRCLMMDPEILLLDEPFQGIGHLFETVSTKYLLERTTGKNRVTVIVSHDFELLCKFCDRVLLVDDAGVIEMVPTRDPHWRPTNVRSAWTIGVENMIPVSLARLLMPKGMPETAPGTALAFWGKDATWNTESKNGMTLCLPHTSIKGVRRYLVHGTPYTQVDLLDPDSHTFIQCSAKGTVEQSKDCTLCVHEHWMLTEEPEGTVSV